MIVYTIEFYSTYLTYNYFFSNLGRIRIRFFSSSAEPDPDPRKKARILTPAGVVPWTIFSFADHENKLGSEPLFYSQLSKHEGVRYRCEQCDFTAAGVGYLRKLVLQSQHYAAGVYIIHFNHSPP